MNEIIERVESQVRSYSRAFPTVFTHAEGATLVNEDGRRFVDFLAGAGSLNYGHNHPHLREVLVDYLVDSGVTHGLDMATQAKCEFLETFDRLILAPRNLDYKVMFPGPTGTNAIEAALKLARKVTGRTNVIAFTNAFHGMTLGSLALTGNATKRRGAGVPLPDVARMPFDGFLGPRVESLDVVEAYLSDPSSGVDPPAAFVVETVQGEGGLNVASKRWLRRLAQIAREHDSLLIIDDVQMGCGRTGSFFSFEEAGLLPDIVCLSKSISGYGLPFALTLFRPELDVWSPGEHNGTFRGNNLAFVTATAALKRWWRDDRLEREVKKKSEEVRTRLSRIAERHDGTVRGRGFALGIAFEDPDVAARASYAAFERGVVMETAGPRGEVLKFLAPLTITTAELSAGLDIMERAVDFATGRTRSRPPATRTAPARELEVQA